MTAKRRWSDPRPPDIGFDTDNQGNAVVVLRGTYGRKNQGRGVFVARITGPDTKYRYAREWLGDQRTVTVHQDSDSWTEQHVVVRLSELHEGDILDASGGRFMNQRGFFRYHERRADEASHGWIITGPSLEPVTEEQVRQVLGLRLADDRESKKGRKFRMELKDVKGSKDDNI